MNELVEPAEDDLVWSCRLAGMFPYLLSIKRRSQDDLAQCLRISLSQLTLVEQGKQSISLDQFVRAAKFFGLTPAILISLCDTTESHKKAWRLYQDLLHGLDGL